MRKVVVLAIFCFLVWSIWSSFVWAPPPTPIYSDNASSGGCSTLSATYTPATRACGSGSDTVHSTFRAGAKAVTAGGILYVRGGTTYTETYFGANVTTDLIASGGGSWATATQIIGYPGDTQPVLKGVNVRGTARSYITFDNLHLDAAHVENSAFAFGSSHNHIKLTNSRVRRGKGTGTITAGVGSADHWLSYNTIEDCGGPVQEIGDEHCLYIHGVRFLVEYNTIFNARDYGIHLWASTANVNDDMVIRYNRIYGTSMVNTTGAAIHVCCGNNIQVYNNILGPSDAGSEAGDHGIAVSSGAAATNTKIYNNTIYGHTQDGIELSSISTGALIKNNIIWGNATVSGQAILDNGIGTVKSKNICNTTDGGDCDLTGDPLFIDAAGGNFALQAASPAIAAGVNVSLPYNGALPTIGAHDPPKHSVCSVEDGDANKVRVVFANNIFPPMAGLSTTGWSARVAAGARSVTAVALNGTNRVDLTINGSAATVGQAVDYSYTTTGTLRDSADIGRGSGAAGTGKNQRVNAITQQSCTNNVAAGAPAYVFTQKYFRFHGLRGTEDAPVVLPYPAAAINTNISAVVGGKFRLRLKVACTVADCPAIGGALRYSRNSAAYTVTPDAFDADNLRFYGTGSSDADIPTQGADSTELLTSDHATNVTGSILRTSSAIPTFDLSQNSEVELEYILELDDDATPGDTYDFRLYWQGGTALTAYTVTPRVTVIAMQSGF